MGETSRLKELLRSTLLVQIPVVPIDVYTSKMMCFMERYNTQKVKLRGRARRPQGNVLGKTTMMCME